MKNLSKVISGAIIFSILLASCSFIQNSPTVTTQFENGNLSRNTEELINPAGTEQAGANDSADNSNEGNPTEQAYGNAMEISEPPARYSIIATMDYDNHQLSVNQSILFTNYSEVLLFELVLAAEPNLYPDCFQLETVKVNEVEAVFTLQGDRLEIPLAVPLAIGETLTLTIGYSLNIPVVNSGHLFGYNYFETTLVDWYPFIVPYRDGWILHPQSEVGESLVYETSYFDVSLYFSESTQTLSVAASAPGEEIGNHWHYILPKARSFALSVGPYFQIKSIDVEGIPINSYYFKDEALQGQVVLDEVAKALQTFISLFGDYPYKSLSIVESLYFDGMESDGIFFLGRDFYTRYDGTVLNDLVDIGVHETAHQWWYGAVGNDQALEPWLDEALATYSEKLFYERNYPEVTAWESFRINRYHPSGWINIDVYNGGNFRKYANAVYLRGAQFLEDLRKTVGDEVFFAFIKDYVKQMTGKIATSQNFFRLLHEHTSMDISSIVAEYFQPLDE